MKRNTDDDNAEAAELARLAAQFGKGSGQDDGVTSKPDDVEQSVDEVFFVQVKRNIDDGSANAGEDGLSGGASWQRRG